MKRVDGIYWEAPAIIDPVALTNLRLTLFRISEASTVARRGKSLQIAFDSRPKVYL